MALMYDTETAVHGFLATARSLILSCGRVLIRYTCPVALRDAIAEHGTVDGGASPAVPLPFKFSVKAMPQPERELVSWKL